mmetsp:Transcript_26167/g.66463  ORF Transcript_26167/g.66463 Transcript_26167/m.66463 type:complete len:218 (+) Transcript_26167:264-917(+)
MRHPSGPRKRLTSVQTAMTGRGSETASATSSHTSWPSLQALTALSSRTSPSAFAPRFSFLRRVASTGSRSPWRTSTRRRTACSSTRTSLTTRSGIVSSTQSHRCQRCKPKRHGRSSGSHRTPRLRSACWPSRASRASSSPARSAPSSGSRSEASCQVSPSRMNSSAAMRVYTATLPACCTRCSSARYRRRQSTHLCAKPSTSNVRSCAMRCPSISLA